MSKQDLERQQEDQINEEAEFDAAFDEFSSVDDDEGSDESNDELSDSDNGPEDGEQEPVDYRRQFEDLNHRFKSEVGRQSAYQRRIAEQEREIQILKQGQAKQQQGAGDNPQGSGISDSEWETLKEEFPEIAQGIEAKFKAFDQQFNQRLQQVDQTLAPIRERESKQQLDREYQTLAERHPDYQQVAASKDFNDWLQSQPQPVQQMIQSEYAADAAYLLDAFKREKGGSNQSQLAPQPSNNKVLERSRSVARRGTPKQSAIAEDDFDAAFDYYANKK